MKIEQYWGIIYAIMKSLGVNELEIDKKYFEIDINKFVNMYYHDTLNGNIKVELREKNNEAEIIKEKKKIPEKLTPTSLKGIDNLDEKIEIAHIDTISVIETLNQLIDYLNSKGE